MEDYLEEVEAAIFDILSSNSNSYIFIINIANDICYWSGNSLSTFGLPERKVCASDIWAQVIHKEDFPRFEDICRKAVQDKGKYFADKFSFHLSGDRYMELKCKIWMVSGEGKPDCLVGVLSSLEQEHSVDPVTGLPCNFEFRKYLDYQVEQGGTWTIMMLGLDDFSAVNELYSYAAGNHLLKECTQRIQCNLPRDTFLFRLDGDGFGLIFCGDIAKNIAQWYQNLREDFTLHPLSIGGAQIILGVSAGVSQYPEDGQDYETLYHNAWLALRAAKREGKNRLMVYSEALQEKDKFYAMLQAALRESVLLGFKGFSLVYQPIVHARDRTLAGCEALLRWKHENFAQSVSPAEFVPYLEQNGLMLEVGRWVLETGIRQCAKWMQVKPDFQMNINVSGFQFEDKNFQFRVMDNIAEYGAHPANITLELTESGKVKDTAALRGAFDFLRAQGVHIALDDFGTGYSSLEIFRLLSTDELKIDRSFLERISYDVTDQALLSTLINLSHSMKMVVCVEGIENEKMQNQICQMEPDLLQGYYYGKPMTPEDFEHAFFEEKEPSYIKSLRHPVQGAEREYSMIYASLRPAQSVTLEDLVDNAYAGIFQVGIDEQFTFLTCNEGYRRMLGYTANEVEKKFQNRVLGFVHPEDATKVNREIRRQLGMGDTVAVEFRVVRKDGEALWVVGSGNVHRSGDGGVSLIMVIVDNTCFKLQQHVMEQEYKMHRRMMERLPIGIKCLHYNDELTIEYMSDGFLNLIGYTRKELQDTFQNQYMQLIYEPDRATVSAELKQQIRKGSNINLSYRVCCKNGCLLCLKIVALLDQPDEDGVQRTYSSVVDATQPDGKSIPGMESCCAMLLQNKLHGNASLQEEEAQQRIDKLTGLINKAETEKKIRECIQNAEKDAKFALFIVDIDQLRWINKGYGSFVGDDTLRIAAQRVKEMFRENDIVGRIGGDKFLSFIPYGDSIETVQQKAQRLVEIFREPVKAGGRLIKSSVSVGVACYPDDGTDFYNLFRRADSALYRAKSLGRDCFCLAARF